MYIKINKIPKLLLWELEMIDSLSELIDESLSRLFEPDIMFMRYTAVHANGILYFPRRSQAAIAPNRTLSLL